MNDLQKLREVIGSLEEQASQVQEFNGVLRAVNDARVEIEANKSILSSLSEEQKQLFKDSYGMFDDLEKRLSYLNKKLADLEEGQVKVQRTISELKILTPDQFEHGLEKRLSYLNKKLADLEEGQVKVQRTISELKILTPDQFEHGRDKILLKLTELNFLTPAQYEEGRRATNETLNLLVAELTKKIEQTNQAHQASLSTLKTVTVLGMLALAGGIAYLVFALLK